MEQKLRQRPADGHDRRHHLAQQMPEAATASQITRIVKRMTMRSRVTGLSHGSAALGARVKCPV